MVSTIEQNFANKQAQPQPWLPRKRDSLQIVDEEAEEEMAIFHEKQRQAYDDKEHKVWTKQGVGTREMMYYRLVYLPQSRVSAANVLVI